MPRPGSLPAIEDINRLTADINEDAGMLINRLSEATLLLQMYVCPSDTFSRPLFKIKIFLC